MQYDDPAVERLVWSRLDVGDCWEYRGALTHNGYGATRVYRKHWRIHRLVWELLVGPIPHGLELDHQCRNRRCCNPDHLALATHRENMLASEAPSAHAARKTHCKHGHPLSGDNLQMRGTWRVCRACRYLTGKRRAAERIAA